MRFAKTKVVVEEAVGLHKSLLKSLNHPEKCAKLLIIFILYKFASSFKLYFNKKSVICNSRVFVDLDVLI